MKQKKSLKSLIISLLVITVACGLSVSVIYILTKDKIDTAQIEAANSSLMLVLPEEKGIEIESVEIEEKVTVYKATVNDQVIGYGVKTYSMNGYSGEIELMVGFTPDGNIYRIETVKHSETPGLGDKIERGKSDFSLQFEGKSPESIKMSVRKDGGDIDAITASTVSSRAFIDAIERAYGAYKQVAIK